MAYFGSEFGTLTTKVFSRESMGDREHRGPIIIEEYEGTTVVPPNASAIIDEFANIIIRLS
jgi:N-methylhydantoinase A|tara:strand:- start:774 stop:956 length:183 start_codon:yes stop_codon:yes gene_type:complete